MGQSHHMGHQTDGFTEHTKRNTAYIATFLNLTICGRAYRPPPQHSPAGFRTTIHLDHYNHPKQSPL